MPRKQLVLRKGDKDDKKTITLFPYLTDLTKVLMSSVIGHRSLVPHVGCRVAPTPTPIASTWMNLRRTKTHALNIRHQSTRFKLIQDESSKHKLLLVSAPRMFEAVDRL